MCEMCLKKKLLDQVQQYTLGAFMYICSHNIKKHFSSVKRWKVLCYAFYFINLICLWKWMFKKLVVSKICISCTPVLYLCKLQVTNSTFFRKWGVMYHFFGQTGDKAEILYYKISRICRWTLTYSKYISTLSWTFCKSHFL
jgi:hypothetical protein